MQRNRLDKRSNGLATVRTAPKSKGTESYRKAMDLRCGAKAKKRNDQYSDGFATGRSVRKGMEKAWLRYEVLSKGKD